MNKSKKLYIYATIMIVSFLFAVIAFTMITLKNIVSFNSYESSSIYEIETITTCTTSETLTTTCSTSTNTLITSAQTSSTAIETSQTITSKQTSSETTTATTLTDNDQIIAITNYQIVVIPDETTVKSTKATALTTTITSIVCTDTTALVSTNNRKKLGVFQGTYYACKKGTCGGSGSELIDCSIGNGIVKGSISSRSLFNMLGYYVDGRTTVYIESESCPDLCGYYYLDDSTHESVLGVIDFFYNYEENSPFCGIGRLYDINVYV